MKWPQCVLQAQFSIFFLGKAPLFWQSLIILYVFFCKRALFSWGSFVNEPNQCSCLDIVASVTAAVCCGALQRVAVCCSVLKWVAVGGSGLQCVVVCCSMLQCVAVCCSALHCAAMCSSVLHCAAVCCSVLQCAAVCCSVLQCVAASCSVHPLFFVVWALLYVYTYTQHYSMCTHLHSSTLCVHIYTTQHYSMCTHLHYTVLLFSSKRSLFSGRESLIEYRALLTDSRALLVEYRALLVECRAATRWDLYTAPTQNPSS